MIRSQIMINKENKESFTILIDTNAIIALPLYFKSCKLIEKGPNEINEPNEIITLLQNKGIKSEWLAYERGIKNGFHAFKYLREKAEQYELSVYFPIIGDIEALHLLMERKFDEVLTKRGIQYRLRKKRVFRNIVDFDYNQIYENWNNFKDKLLGDHGIILSEPEKLHDKFWVDIFITLNLLMKYILLDIGDMIIYSIALYLRTNVIYTYDTEFKTIINQISHRQQPWLDVVAHLEQVLIEKFPAFKEEFDKEKKIKFPLGVPPVS